MSEGRLRNRSYDDKRGQRRTITEIYAENMELLTPKRMQQGTTADESEPSSAPQQPSLDNPKNSHFDNDSFSRYFFFSHT